MKKVVITIELDVDTSSNADIQRLIDHIELAVRKVINFAGFGVKLLRYMHTW